MAYSKRTGEPVASGPFVLEKLRRYFEHMNVGEELYDLMIKTSSARMAYIKNSTLKRMDGFKIEPTQTIRFPDEQPVSNYSALYVEKTYSDEIRRNISGN